MSSLSFFFFNDTATTEIYTLSLHDALPISIRSGSHRAVRPRPRPVPLYPAGGGVPPPRPVARPTSRPVRRRPGGSAQTLQDRKSTRLNSSHLVISYAVFCLKKKKVTDTVIR